MLSRLALVLAILPATAFADMTTQDVYQKLWAKRAMDVTDVDTLFKPKAACVCQDGSVSHARAGALLRVEAELACLVPFFSVEGVLVGYHT